MPRKSYLVWLDERTYVEVEFVTVKGRIVSFVVRLMRIEGDQIFGVVRYDTAHGMPHRDIVDRNGRLIRKEWLTNKTFEQALSYAKDDLQTNSQAYIDRFDSGSDTSAA